MAMSGGIINARVTFHDSPIHVLERFVIRDVDGAYRRFRTAGMDECVIIQTCNRVELFARTDGGGDGIKEAWAEITGQEPGELGENIKYSSGRDALHHLLKLTSGLDSMVLGEEQILGQVKNSIAAARSAGASGMRLNTLFEKAIRIGTRVRNSSGIGRGGISVGSMAVKLAEENIDDLKSKKTLLIGTGDVSTLVAKSLQRRGYDFDVTSRTVSRAEAFCASMGGTPVGFEGVLSGFGRYDVIFVATTAPYSLVTHGRIEGAVKSGKKMMILDLSNPRTVDERVATLGGVKLMNLDQISEMVERNMTARRSKAKAVENIIGEEVPVLEASMKRIEAEPLVKGVFKSIESLRERELQKALGMLGEQDGEKVRIIDELTKSLVESIVSTPMNNVRKASEQGKDELVELAGKLFDYKKSGESD